MVEGENQKRLLKLLPESVFKTLVRDGVDLDDPRVFHAIEVTALGFQILDDEERKALKEARLQLAEVRRQYRAENGNQAFDWDANDGFARIAKSIRSLVIILIGLSAAVGALLGGFNAFKNALLHIFGINILGDLLGMVAYAQVGSIGNSATNQVALPIFVYGIYVVFTIAYVVCLFGLFFGKLPKDRSNAMEMLKTLTAFFIGVISGKFV